MGVMLLAIKDRKAVSTRLRHVFVISSVGSEVNWKSENDVCSGFMPIVIFSPSKQQANTRANLLTAKINMTGLDRVGIEAKNSFVALGILHGSNRLNPKIWIYAQRKKKLEESREGAKCAKRSCNDQTIPKFPGARARCKTTMRKRCNVLGWGANYPKWGSCPGAVFPPRLLRWRGCAPKIQTI